MIKFSLKNNWIFKSALLVLFLLLLTGCNSDSLSNVVWDSHGENELTFEEFKKYVDITEKSIEENVNYHSHNADKVIYTLKIKDFYKLTGGKVVYWFENDTYIHDSGMNSAKFLKIAPIVNVKFKGQDGYFMYDKFIDYLNPEGDALTDRAELDKFMNSKRFGEPVKEYNQNSDYKFTKHAIGFQSENEEYEIIAYIREPDKYSTEFQEYLLKKFYESVKKFNPKDYELYFANLEIDK